MHLIKKILKIFLIILLIGTISFTIYRYYKLKKENKLEKVFSRKETNLTSADLGNYADANNYLEDSEKSDTDTSDEDISKENNSSNEKYVVEEKNYDNYHNQFNFDNRLLLYEGKQQSKATKEAIDILIKDVDDPLYSKPEIVFENFNGLTSNKITSENLEEYKAVLIEAQNLLGENSYIFSFEYNKLKTYANKVIIQRVK